MNWQLASPAAAAPPLLVDGSLPSMPFNRLLMLLPPLLRPPLLMCGFWLSLWVWVWLLFWSRFSRRVASANPAADVLMRAVLSASPDTASSRRSTPFFATDAAADTDTGAQGTAAPALVFVLVCAAVAAALLLADASSTGSVTP